jgi:hypothetical protein
MLELPSPVVFNRRQIFSAALFVPPIFLTGCANQIEDQGHNPVETTIRLEHGDLSQLQAQIDSLPPGAIIHVEVPMGVDIFCSKPKEIVVQNTHEVYKNEFVVPTGLHIDDKHVFIHPEGPEVTFHNSSQLGIAIHNGSLTIADSKTLRIEGSQVTERERTIDGNTYSIPAAQMYIYDTDGSQINPLHGYVFLDNDAGNEVDTNGISSGAAGLVVNNCRNITIDGITVERPRADCITFIDTENIIMRNTTARESVLNSYAGLGIVRGSGSISMENIVIDTIPKGFMLFEMRDSAIQISDCSFNRCDAGISIDINAGSVNIDGVTIGSRVTPQIPQFSRWINVNEIGNQTVPVFIRDVKITIQQIDLHYLDDIPFPKPNELMLLVFPYTAQIKGLRAVSEVTEEELLDMWSFVLYKKPNFLKLVQNFLDRYEEHCRTLPWWNDTIDIGPTLSATG